MMNETSMVRFSVSIVLVLIQLSAFSQTLENYRNALSILGKSQTSMGSIRSIILSAKGTIHNLGHYETPEKTKDIPLAETYGFFAQEQVVYLVSELQNRGKIYQRTAISKADSLYDRNYYDEVFVRGSAGNFAFEMAKALPTEMLRLAYDNRRSLRFLGERSPYNMISFSYATNQNATLFIHQQTNLLEKVETLGYSSLYGDVSIETVYKNFNNNEGIKIPSVRMDYEFGLLEREVTYTNIQFGLKPDTNILKLKGIPENFKNRLVEPTLLAEHLEFSAISPTLDLVKIISQDNKVLIAKFADYIALFETPQGIDLNNQLIVELQKRYPDKPLRYLFVTHHHPDHAGGIKAYANLPITLITTHGNQHYFEKLLATTHSIGTLNATKVEIPKLKMDFVPTGGEKKIGDKLNFVTAYEIGKNTSHTSEHLVYYFPRSKILWTGDLLFFDQEESVYPAGARGKSILDLLQTKKIIVEEIYTSWPLHGQKEYGTVDFLKKMVLAN
jgi:glyoxylase-like metal-dependent hydrolase (beta-lactamase superfamily II)